MTWRSEMVLTLAVLGAAAPTLALAQQKPDPACACFVTDTPTVPGEEPGGDGSGGGARTLAILGAAGIAVLSGLPFGGTSIQGLPFVVAPVEPARPGVQVALEPGLEPVLLPDAPAAPARALAPGALATAAAPAPIVPATILGAPIERAGIVPPRTATHLPLLAAVGVMMMGGGALLARRNTRERRRKRRFIATM